MSTIIIKATSKSVFFKKDEEDGVAFVGGVEAAVRSSPTGDINVVSNVYPLFTFRVDDDITITDDGAPVTPEADREDLAIQIAELFPDANSGSGGSGGDETLDEVLANGGTLTQNRNIVTGDKVISLDAVPAFSTGADGGGTYLAIGGLPSTTDMGIRLLTKLLGSYIDIVAANGVVDLGDVQGNGNSTHLAIIDSDQKILANANLQIKFFTNGGRPSFELTGADVNIISDNKINIGLDTKISVDAVADEIDYAAGLHNYDGDAIFNTDIRFQINNPNYENGIFQAGNDGTVTIGDVAGDVNGTQIAIQDSTQEISLTAIKHTFNGKIINPDIVAKDFADDAAAATGGVSVGEFYHSSGTVKVRLI